MVQRLNRAEAQRLPQFFALLSKGTPFNEANKIIRLQTGKGIRGEVAGRYLRKFRLEQQRAVDSIPGRRSDRLRESDAQLVPFVSKELIPHRYLVDISYEALDPQSGERRQFTNTMGLRRLVTRGQLDDLIQERLQQISVQAPEIYLQTFTDINFESAEISGFYRTLNH